MKSSISLSLCSSGWNSEVDVRPQCTTLCSGSQAGYLVNERCAVPGVQCYHLCHTVLVGY